jgi:hypothetical protein
MAQWVVSVLGLEPLHLRAALILRVRMPQSEPGRFRAAARLADAATPTPRTVNAPVTTAVDLTPEQRRSARPTAAGASEARNYSPASDLHSRGKAAI